MQGKVSSENSASTEVTVGIDTCKEWLDVHVLPANTELRVSNTKKGHKQLLAALKGLDVRVIVIEATGKHHRSVHRFLHETGYVIAVVNPLRSRLFAEALGQLAKTDKVDARMLAMLGAMTRPKATPPLPANLENLREVVRARDAVIADKVALENRLGATEQHVVRTEITRLIAFSRRAIDRLEAEALRLIKADAGFARRLVVLTSIPGVGDITAIGLIANMPELGSLDAKAAGMLAGLAPIACDSGQSKGQRHTRCGRKTVRTGIYMAALSAATWNPALKRFHDRLVAAGKRPKVALTAVMRKLLVLANSLLKDDRCWSQQSPIAKSSST